MLEFNSIGEKGGLSFGSFEFIGDKPASILAIYFGGKYTNGWLSTTSEWAICWQESMVWIGGWDGWINGWDGWKKGCFGCREGWEDWLEEQALIIEKF